jgi:hypothetical protein
MRATTSSRRRAAGWLTEALRAVHGGRLGPTSLVGAIERARTCGVHDAEIAARLEEAIDIRPLTIARNSRHRLECVMADGEVTLDDLLNTADEE